MRKTNWISSAVLVAVAGAWSAIMAIVGTLLIVEWPARVGWWAKPWMYLGAALIAAGEFVFALAAARLFPQASRWVKGAFESLPWVVMVVLIAGGWLW